LPISADPRLSAGDALRAESGVEDVVKSW